jgi:hypothetical protein
MQFDGNLVFYDLFGNPLWSSITAGDGGAFVVFENDGDLIIFPGVCSYDPNNGDCAEYSLFFSGTVAGNTSTGLPALILAVQDDGNLVLYDTNWNPVWAATNFSYYNFTEQANVLQYCGC